ncbi:outer membrane receptor for ferrienterochelin and colicins [Nitratiruptor sp. YY08-26]|nr:outer membrane receptor for ferrienterochelin and colicins [Nitratiruptor sp. YY08-13]BCD65572.1 outer membrane receptor for ferrienterochelin and colicins [Nitratiruptor sp. YY08-26]
MKIKNIGFSVALATMLLQAEDINLGEVTVTTATKTEKNIEGVSASVIVIDEKTIEKMGASTLGDVISKTPGLIRQYGTFPSASSKSKSSISIRGMGATGTLFLIDGQRIAGEVKNPYDLDRIPASIIERIEIVKGPMSTLYGADAVGGVINIITKQPKDKFQGSMGIQSGSNTKGKGRNSNAYFNMRGKKDKLKYSFYVDASHSTPYTQREIAHVLVPKPGNPNEKVPPSQHPKFAGKAKDTYATDVTYREKADVFNIGTKFGYEISDTLNTGLAFSYMDEKRWGTYIGYFHPSGYKNNQGKPIPAFNVPVNSKDHNTRRNISGYLKWSASDDLSLKLKIYNNYYEKRNTTTMKHWKDFGYNSEAESAANGMNANVDITSYELLGNYALNDAHLLTFGTEYRDEEREATVFDSTPNMGKKEVDYKAIYLQDEWEVSDTLNVIAGARYDAISNADNKATFRLGAVKNFSKLFNLRVNFAQGYRTPDIRELYINKQTPMGLIQGAEVVGYNLKPEFTNSYEISASGAKERFSYEIAFFLNKIDDRIQKVAGSKPGTYTFVNISDAETKGLELTLDYNFGNGLNSELTWNELRTKDKRTGKDLEFNPDRVVALKFDYIFSKNFNMNIIATYTGEQHYTKMTPKGKVELTTNPYTLVDLTASYKFAQNYELFGGVNNLFDEDVDDVLGSTVGTYIYAGLRVNF